MGSFLNPLDFFFFFLHNSSREVAFYYTQMQPVLDAAASLGQRATATSPSRSGLQGASPQGGRTGFQRCGGARANTSSERKLQLLFSTPCFSSPRTGADKQADVLKGRFYHASGVIKGHRRSRALWGVAELRHTGS